ncbi:MAG: hypothetical protein ISR46_03655 [Rhodospirillales bacterium]|nr:hypothetical protein [Rhodospirillales bacterium]
MSVMANTITTSIQHEDTNDVDIKIKRKKNVINEFSLVGRLNTMHATITTKDNVDIVDLMDTLNPTAISLFKEIKDKLNYKTNEATLDKPLSKSQQKSRSTAINKLRKHNAIKKSAQRTFVVNPYLIVPPADFQLDVLDKWRKLP